jgi:hypothetical protein
MVMVGFTTTVDQSEFAFPKRAGSRIVSMAWLPLV